MRSTFAALGFAAAAAAAPQGAFTVANPPTTPSAPAAAPGCSTTYPGTFEIQTVNITSSAKRTLHARKNLVVSLTNGLLVDDENRQGYIASNYQFQFNTPVQSNSVYVDGFSVCQNGTLAIGNSAVWYQCLSGDFYNLYSESIGGQCTPIYIEVINPSSGSAPVSQISDGQPQATTGVPVTEISDGQPQATTGVPVTEISDGQPQAPTGVPVTEISDGQPQAPTGVPVTEISDGQPQAPTGVPVTEISDGQPQAPTGVPVTQISDGQIQAPTSTGNITSPPTISPYIPGNAAPTAGLRAELFGLAAGVLAVALL